MIPRCTKKAEGGQGTYRAYCGDTCNCGYREFKRETARRVVLAQVAAFEKRWGPLR